MATLLFEAPPKRTSRGGRRKGPYFYEEYIPIVEEFLASGEQYGHITDESVTNILLRNRVESALWHSSDRTAATVRMYDGDVYLVRRRDR